MTRHLFCDDICIPHLKFTSYKNLYFRLQCLNKKKNSFRCPLCSAWRRPALTGGNPQLPSALKSLTAVFGMGTGVTSSPSSLDSSAFHTHRTSSSTSFVR